MASFQNWVTAFLAPPAVKNKNPALFAQGVTVFTDGIGSVRKAVFYPTEYRLA